MYESTVAWCDAYYKLNSGSLESYTSVIIWI